MKAEYFPPKEDVILQNEAPTDFYILVNGTAVIKLTTFLYSFVELTYIRNKCETNLLLIRLCYDAGLGGSQQWNRNRKSHNLEEQ